MPISNNSYYGSFLGLFANGNKTSGQDAWKTYNLDGNGGQISFTLHRMDTWDGEAFRVYANDEVVFEQSLWGGNYGDSPFTYTRPWGYAGTSIAHNDYGLHYGSNGFDQSFDISITIPTGVSSLKLGFGSTLNEPSSNESYGIDNIAVVNASQNPGLYAPSSNSIDGRNLDYIMSTASVANRTVVNPGGTPRQVGSISSATNK